MNPPSPHLKLPELRVNSSLFIAVNECPFETNNRKISGNSQIIGRYKEIPVHRENM